VSEKVAYYEQNEHVLAVPQSSQN